MVDFAVARNSKGNFTVLVDQVDVGSNVDAAKFRQQVTPDVTSGLTARFGDAVNDVQPREVAAAPAAQKPAQAKPQGFDA